MAGKRKKIDKQGKGVAGYRQEKGVARGDFLFFYPSTWIERFISGWIGRYFHCGLYLGNDLVIDASILKGIDFRLLSEYKRNYDIYRIKDLGAGELDEMIQFAIGMRGKRYDLRQALALPFFKFFSRSDYYFCSEFLALLCILVGRIPSKHPESLSPTQLANESFLIKQNLEKLRYGERTD